MASVVLDPAQIKIEKLFIKTNNNKTITVRNLTGATKVSDLRTKLKDEENGSFGDAYFLYGGKQITETDDNKILADFGIKNNSTLNVVFRVHGGTQVEGVDDVPDPIPDEPTVDEGPRKILADAKNIPKDVTLVKDKCDFLSDLPSANCMHAKMPCNHVVSSLGTFEYLKSSITNGNEFIIKCPMSGCNREWNIDTCLWIAKATEEEEKAFFEKLNVNAVRHPASKIKDCPNCGAYVRRPDNLKQNCVRCPVCKWKDWCWWCRQEWIASGLQECIREDCSHNAQLASLLLNCDKENISGIANVPTVRLCPQCGTMLNWKDNCKHITCSQCKYEFCISCLKKWSDVGGNKHLQDTTADKCPIHKTQNV